jgi:hypothetical protein
MLIRNQSCGSSLVQYLVSMQIRIQRFNEQKCKILVEKILIFLNKKLQHTGIYFLATIKDVQATGEASRIKKKDLDPDLHSQCGFGSSRPKSMRIHANFFFSKQNFAIYFLVFREGLPEKHLALQNIICFLIFLSFQWANRSWILDSDSGSTGPFLIPDPDPSRTLKARLLKILTKRRRRRRASTRCVWGRGWGC